MHKGKDLQEILLLIDSQIPIRVNSKLQKPEAASCISDLRLTALLLEEISSFLEASMGK